jgi:hypothetical protein
MARPHEIGRLFDDLKDAIRRDAVSHLKTRIEEIYRTAPSADEFARQVMNLIEDVG